MPKFTVYFTSTVSTAIEVDADDCEAAIEAAQFSGDMPGALTVGAFGRGADVDSGGEWTPDAVEDAAGAEVWPSSAPPVEED